MKKTLLHYTIILISLIVCMGCNDDPSESVQYFQNIVTFKDNSGDYVVMTYRQIDDSPLVTLRAAGSIDTQKTPRGSRLLCTYTLPSGVEPGTDAVVNVVSLLQAYTAPLEEAEVEDIPYTDNGINVQTLYRTGEYINLTCRQEENQSRRFHITLDLATAHDPMPTVYLTTSTERDQASPDGLYVASFDFSALWARSGVEGVKIKINNINNKYLKEFTFTKPNNI